GESGRGCGAGNRGCGRAAADGDVGRGDVLVDGAGRPHLETSRLAAGGEATGRVDRPARGRPSDGRRRLIEQERPELLREARRDRDGGRTHLEAAHDERVLTDRFEPASARDVAARVDVEPQLAVTS